MAICMQDFANLKVMQDVEESSRRTSRQGVEGS